MHPPDPDDQAPALMASGYRLTPNALARTRAALVRPAALTEVRVYHAPDGVTLVTPRDAGRLMGVLPRAIYDWIARGKVRVRRTASGQIRVEVESLWQRDADVSSAGTGVPAPVTSATPAPEPPVSWG